ncbi:MAG TPA: dihydropteroate synthase [Streptosporangiaceae bacterium]|jgi:dihydropteroate synthase type 2|nr:dihydropteroate synthase [Streptosporangiaceae bacterium]
MTSAFAAAGEPPRLIGIVNITEDSFSDGGLYLAPDRALAHARRLYAGGADIIELGAAASHPDSRPVPPGEEQRRLGPVLDALVAQGVPVSVDSCAPATQRFALAHGAAYLNDIRGFPAPGEYPALRAAAARLIVMHSVQRGDRADRAVTDPAGVWAGIGRFFAGRLEALRAAGIGPDRVIIDPGLGYFLGGNPAPSLRALAGIGELRDRFGVPVLVCPSRKSFLRALTGRETGQLGPATLAAELFAVGQGAGYIRTHDPAALHDALTVFGALAGRQLTKRAARSSTR